MFGYSKTLSVLNGALALCSQPPFNMHVGILLKLMLLEGHKETQGVQASS